MKRISLIILLFNFVFANAQTPNKFNYQAVVRDADGNLIKNGNIGLRMSVLADSESGKEVYSETHTVETNVNGLFTVLIGDGKALNGSLEDIQWGESVYFLKSEIDLTGGQTYNLTSVAQLVSVPYAIHSKYSDSVLNEKVDSLNNLADVTYQNGSLYMIGFKPNPVNNTLYNTSIGYRASNHKVGEHNTAVGSFALSWNDSGSNNVALGYMSLFDNIKGTGNIGIGYGAVGSNKFGNNNIGIGINAMSGTATNVSNNIAIGMRSMHKTTGNNSIAIGDSSLFRNRGASNTAIGHNALQNNSDGDYNIGIGTYALSKNTVGFNNLSIGDYTLQNNLLGYNNIAIGRSSLNKNKGNHNLAIGFVSLYGNTTGANNIAIGVGALTTNTEGSRNIAIGGNSNGRSQLGKQNISIGDLSMRYNSTGNNNIAIGIGSLGNNYSGNSNLAIGNGVMRSSVSRKQNVALGDSALMVNDADNNIAIGYQSLVANTTGTANTAIGTVSMSSNTSGSYNVAIKGLAQNISGSYNVSIGRLSLRDNTTGSFNTAIGTYSGLNGNYSNTTGLGYYANPSANNRIRLGNTSVSRIGGQVSWSNLSDARFKRNIRTDEVKGLDFILKLQPVTYQFDIHKYNSWQSQNNGIKDTSNWEGKYDIEKIRYSGFLAQDVEKAAQNAGYDFSGVDKPANEKDVYSLKYAEFVVPLVKSVQELNAQLELQKEIIQNQSQQIEILIKEIESLKKQ